MNLHGKCKQSLRTSVFKPENKDNKLDVSMQTKKLCALDGYYSPTMQYIENIIVAGEKAQGKNK